MIVLPRRPDRDGKRPHDQVSSTTMPDCPVCDVRGSRDVSDVSRRRAASVNVPAKISSVDLMDTLTAWAQDLARALLADALPRRWAHVQGVAARARSLAPASAPTPDCWKPPPGCTTSATSPNWPPPACTAWTAPATSATSSTPNPMLCRLVAHHSCAVIEAEERGLAALLNREFPPPPQHLADALTFSDMTTSPDGEHVQVHRRLAEIHDRYGSAHLVSRFISRATPSDPGSRRPRARQHP